MGGAPASSERVDKPAFVLSRLAAWGRARDVLFPALLTVFAAFTRFHRLAEPRGVAFDEVHFMTFTNWTLQQWFYFDIHPPFAKLVFAAGALLLGYDHSKCDALGGGYYAPDCEYWKLRIIAAAFSTAAVPLMYFIARQLGGSPWAGALAAGFVSLDFLHLVEGRTILMESQLMFWLILALHVALRWWARLNAVADAGGAEVALTRGERLRWVLLLGFVFGNCISIKHTGLGMPGLALLESAFGLYFLRRPAPFWDVVGVVAAMAATYTLWFRVHFANMIHSHGLWRQEEEFMTPQFQSLLVGSKSYDPLAQWSEGFWWTFARFNKRMVEHSAAVSPEHAWGTRPSDWIADARGVAFFGSVDRGDGPAEYLIGNPIVLWPAAALLLVVLAALVLYLRLKPLYWGLHPFADAYRRALAPLAAPALFCWTGFAVNLLPYALVERATFLYHYMPALLFAEVLAALFVDRLLGKRAVLCWLLACVAAWLHWWPWIYYTDITADEHARRRWRPRWN